MADVARSSAFYERAIGLEPIGENALGAGGRTLLKLLEADPGAPAPPQSTGLFHVAFLHPDRAELARALRRLAAHGARLSGASDHGVSEALYLNDPDWNGIELYRDRPREEWPVEPDGSVAMMTMPLDLDSLLREANAADGHVDIHTSIGHVHLKVSDIGRSVAFYRDELGLNLRQAWGDQAAFLAAGDYHHHVGLNTWLSLGGEPPPPGSAGLERFTVAATGSAEPAEVRDPDGIVIGLIAAQ